ncbi:MAG: hypothetical protein KKD25_01720 [Gammaproteobacteria bacterium]|nr:hypothetical protein [Gammaproteobacteria bacterium]MBU0771766.1 hypothetical protein [Gammaproteobacteria bacterium]MBU0855522.1 hypothetical protein [Gammaproteobacteria bacterium]MBU1846084.1 hypothetical protein [Gammaproteobacteria bacterium]
MTADAEEPRMKRRRAVTHDRVLPEESDRMEARIARLEAHIEHIREDVSSIKVDIRILLGMIIAAALGLAGLMAKGFGWF